MGAYDIFVKCGCDSLARMVGPRKFEGVMYVRTEDEPSISKEDLGHRVGILNLREVNNQIVDTGQRPEEYASFIEGLIESEGVPLAICLDGNPAQASSLVEKIVERYERVYGKVIVYNFSFAIQE